MVSRVSWAIVAIFVSGGCEFSKVTILDTAPVLIVQGVLNTGQQRQYIVVENTMTGAGAPSDGFRRGRLPHEPARKPVGGARVTIEMLNAGPECPTTDVVLHEVSIEELPSYNPDTNLSGPSGIYDTEELCPLFPGARLRLEVEAPDGRTATAVTTVPGVQQAHIGVRRNSSVQADTLLLHRTRDSIWVDIDPLHGRAIQLEVVDVERRAHGIVFTTVTDTMSAVLSGATVLPFQGDNGDNLFKAGVYYDFTVAVTDTNYFDFARSASDDITGRGFINHVRGGIGVFGAVHPVVRTVKVIADQTDPREGTYRITGAIDDAPVDITLDVFMQRPRTVVTSPGTASLEIDRHFGHVEGVWAGDPITVGATGALERDPSGPLPDYKFTVSWPRMDRLSGRYYDELRVYLASDPSDLSAPFTLEVWSDSIGAPVGQLTARKR